MFSVYLLLNFKKKNVKTKQTKHRNKICCPKLSGQMNPVGIHFFQETNFNVISSLYLLSLLIAELQEEKRKNKTNETSEQNLLSEVKRP